MTAFFSKLAPRSLAARATVLLASGLVVVHIGSVCIHEISLRSSHQANRDRALAEALWSAVRNVALSPPERRDIAAQTLSGPGLELDWRETSPPMRDEGSLSEVRAGLVRAVPEVAAIRLGYGVTGHHLVGSLPLEGAGVLTFSAPFFLSDHDGPFDHVGFISLLALSLGVGLVSLFVLRNLTRPLGDLSRAADRIGRDDSTLILNEAGPTEIQNAARAFNSMQGRIRRLLDDRTLALAAVSHDLRTPITRMRLLVGFLEDAEARDELDANLDEMEGMVESVLDYMREGAVAETPRTTDLAAMLRTLCDTAADMGGDVAFDGPGRLVQTLRPVLMRRALSNLVTNAVTYGGSARVALRLEEAGVVIRIDDDGPGIPEAELQRVLQPFQRLEASRNRATGGVGLGLTIAVRFIEAEGGTLMLSNWEEGGLRAQVTLPHRPPAVATGDQPG